MKALAVILQTLAFLLLVAVAFAGHPLDGYSILEATLCEANGQTFRCLVLTKTGADTYYALYDDEMNLFVIVESTPADQPDRIVWHRPIRT